MPPSPNPLPLRGGEGYWDTVWETMPLPGDCRAAYFLIVIQTACVLPSDSVAISFHVP